MSEDKKTEVKFTVHHRENVEGEKLISVQEKEIEIPKFIPPKIKRKGTFDWEPYHRQIFIMLAQGKAAWNIANTLELEPSAVYNYIKRYLPNYRRRRGEKNGGV